jgi:hypothetical protein
LKIGAYLHDRGGVPQAPTFVAAIAGSLHAFPVP